MAANSSRQLVRQDAVEGADYEVEGVSILAGHGRTEVFKRECVEISPLEREARLARLEASLRPLQFKNPHQRTADVKNPSALRLLLRSCFANRPAMRDYWETVEYIHRNPVGRGGGGEARELDLVELVATVNSSSD